MFQTACRLVANDCGKEKLIPVRSLDEKEKVKLLQLVVMKKKRKFFFFTKYSYRPTQLQLNDQLLEAESSISVKTENEDLLVNYKRTKTCSVNGKFDFGLGAKIRLGASKEVTLSIKIGRVVKTYVLLTELIKALENRKLILRTDLIKKARKDKQIICLVTGVVQANDGHISMDSAKYAEVDVSAKTPHQVSGSINASVHVGKDNQYHIESTTVLAYRINELKVIVKDGGSLTIMEEGLHGGFVDSIQYDGASSFDKDKQDIQCPEEVFQAILDLPEKDRNQLTSIILEMMSNPRDIPIFAKQVKKLESQKTKKIHVQDLEKLLLTQKESWLYLFKLAGLTVQVSGELNVPGDVTPLLTCFGVLFDALSDLEEEELNLIGKCASQTVPALFATFKAVLSKTKVTVSDVETISKDGKADELLKHLGFSVSIQEILPPPEDKDNFLTIDEVYVVMFALWGQKSK